jgi:hypothetical protein
VDYIHQTYLDLAMSGERSEAHYRGLTALAHKRRRGFRRNVGNSSRIATNASTWSICTSHQQSG